MDDAFAHDWDVGAGPVPGNRAAYARVSTLWCRGAHGRRQAFLGSSPRPQAPRSFSP